MEFVSNQRIEQAKRRLKEYQSKVAQLERWLSVIDPVVKPIPLPVKMVKRQYKNTLPPKYRSYQQRANIKGIAFELTVDEFCNMLLLPCLYCKMQATGIDRINSSEGYTLLNSVPCCYQCNMMKHRFLQGDFIAKCKLISSLH